MNTRVHQAPFLVFGSFILALLLTIVPVPDWAMHLRPQWLTLMVIYWCLTTPENVGMTIAWITGLLLDVMTGNLIGLHALTQSIIAFLVLNIYQRTRIFPLWQQSLVVFALLLLEHVIHFWILGLTADIHPGKEYWLKPVVGLFIWPWLFIILGEIRHRLDSKL
ncbi:MAG: rod shape-determining protein MreD [Gammaproteobacteria bacterium]|jgi:rod shape-determining protein MreD